jgi:hypothetical protein
MRRELAANVQVMVAFMLHSFLGSERGSTLWVDAALDAKLLNLVTDNNPRVCAWAAFIADRQRQCCCGADDLQ